MEKLLSSRIREAVELGKKMFGGGEQLGRACTPAVSGANISRWATGVAVPRVAQVENLLELVGAQLVLPGENVRDFARVVQVADTEAVQQSLMQTAYDGEPESVVEYVLSRKHAQPNMLFHPDYLEKIGVEAPYCFLLEVHNDNMFPTMRAGDQVLADKTQTDVTMSPELFVIYAEGGIMVRRLSKVGGVLNLTQDSGNRTISLNQEQQAEISVLGKVVWIGKRIA